MSDKCCIRILHDISEVNNCSNEKLYYYPDECNLKKGYGIVIGNPDTPYHNGIYIFEFEFPDDYPNSPPKCKYINPSTIRISPNFHHDGSICASRLNTWNTEDKNSYWVPNMTIYSVLKLIQFNILTKDPLDNEPPYNYTKEYTKEALEYEQLVGYHNIYSNVILVHRYLSRNLLIPRYVAENVIKIINLHIKNNKEWYFSQLSSGIKYHYNIYEKNYNKCDYDKLSSELASLLSKLDITRVKVKVKVNH